MLEQNIFVEGVLPGLIQRQLSGQEMDHYRQPFAVADLVFGVHRRRQGRSSTFWIPPMTPTLGDFLTIAGQRITAAEQHRR